MSQEQVWTNMEMGFLSYRGKILEYNLPPWLKHKQKDVKAIIAQRREKRRAKAARQALEEPLKISHFSVTFLGPRYTY